MSDPSASMFNFHFSIEKFLWDNVASLANVLLINQGDIATRLEELLQTDRAVIWHTAGGSAGNTGELTLHVGVTTINDPGGINRLALQDKVKNALDVNAGIEIFDYASGLPTVKVNEFAIVGPVRFWPVFTDPVTRFITANVSQKLKFAQRRV